MAFLLCALSLAPITTSLTGSTTRGATTMAAGDAVAPAAPVITLKPTDPSPTSDTDFEWTHERADVTFQCSYENREWVVCSTPLNYTVIDTNSGMHQFAVRAVDHAGTVSSAASYSWKIGKVAFGIAGTVSGLAPGRWIPIDITFTNPYNQQIYVTGLTVIASGGPAGCSASANVEFQQAPLSSTRVAAVPAHSSAPLQSADRPLIRLKNLSTNQDACKNGSFSLGYTGMARK